jgi:hypothetical protein
MDLKISGNFRAIQKDCHKANPEYIRFLFATMILLLRGGICQEVFDISDHDVQSSGESRHLDDGVVLHDWGYLKSRSGRTRPVNLSKTYTFFPVPVL